MKLNFNQKSFRYSFKDLLKYSSLYGFPKNLIQGLGQGLGQGWGQGLQQSLIPSFKVDFGGLGLFQAKTLRPQTLLLVLGLGGAIVVGGVQGIRVMQQWQTQRQEEATLAHLQTLAMDGNYGECQEQGAAVASTASIYTQVQTLIQGCQTAQAQDLHGQGDLVGAIVLLSQSNQGGLPNPAAPDLTRQWLEELVALTETQLAEGDLAGAMGLVEALPDGVPGVEALRQLQTQWAAEWKTNTDLMVSASRSLERGRWLEAHETLKKVSPNPYWQQQIKPLQTQAKAGIDRVMARERAAKRLAQQQRAAAQSAAKAAPSPIVPATPSPESGEFTQRLESIYNTYREEGMDELSAWETACTTMGGKVVDQGPESACQ